MPTVTNIIWSISVHIIVWYPFSRQSIVRTNAELLSNGTNRTILYFLSDLDVILHASPMIWGGIRQPLKFPLASRAARHDDVIKWKHFPRYWPFVRGIHRYPVNSPHKGQWRGALMLSLICVWINACVNNREAGDLRRYPAHYDVTVMLKDCVLPARGL